MRFTYRVLHHNFDQDLYLKLNTCRGVEKGRGAYAPQMKKLGGQSAFTPPPPKGGVN